jgi:hypothetical protein
MGKIKQGILGGFRGKVGTVIGASWNGISYMRGIAQSVRNANTAAQQTQRGFFRELLDLVGQFSNEQLEFLFPSTPKGMTRRNMLLQQFADGKVIDGDTKTVDLTEVKTVGNAPTAELPAVTVTAAGENLTISWNGDTDARTAAAAEYPTVFVANTTKKRVFLVNSTTALGATGEASFQCRPVRLRRSHRHLLRLHAAQRLQDRPRWLRHDGSHQASRPSAQEERLNLLRTHAQKPPVRTAFLGRFLV